MGDAMGWQKLKHIKYLANLINDIIVHNETSSKFSSLTAHLWPSILKKSPSMAIRYKVSADYTVIDRAPLTLAAGDTVKVGRTDADWPGWVWVTAADGRGSYVPVDILDLHADPTARVLQPFAAHDLSVKARELVHSLRHVKGWHWCQNSQGMEGWLPAYLLQEAD
jgi:hypothetical protein